MRFLIGRVAPYTPMQKRQIEAEARETERILRGGSAVQLQGPRRPLDLEETLIMMIAVWGRRFVQCAPGNEVGWVCGLGLWARG